MGQFLGIRDVWAVRIFAGITLLLMLVAFILCMAQGSANPGAGTYLLGFNVIFSTAIAAFIARWYSVGELNESKLWYVLLLGCLLIMQTIVYEVYAFHFPLPLVPTTSTSTSTLAPTITTTLLTTTSSISTTTLASTTTSTESTTA